VAFGEADSGWVTDKVAVEIVWRGAGEGANEQELAGGGFEEVGAADDLRDSHGCVIDAKGISKAYGDNLLFENLTFSLPPGGIVGVIGPNGAGKPPSSA